MGMVASSGNMASSRQLVLLRRWCYEPFPRTPNAAQSAGKLAGRGMRHIYEAFNFVRVVRYAFFSSLSEGARSAGLFPRCNNGFQMKAFVARQRGAWTENPDRFSASFPMTQAISFGHLRPGCVDRTRNARRLYRRDKMPCPSQCGKFWRTCGASGLQRAVIGEFLKCSSSLVFS